jgi:acyl carrier protein phosphodiesterase
VVYDHFLATDANEFSEQSLFEFSVGVYSVIDAHQSFLPPGFATMFPYMKNYNWLFNYRSMQGTRRSLGGVVRRAAYLTESDTAFYLFEKHYQPLQECYRQFWKDARRFARRQLDLIRETDNNM